MMSPPKESSRTWVFALLVVALLAGLPVAVWADLTALSETALRRQAGDFNEVITGIRGFYTRDVVGRILAAHGRDTQVVFDYARVPGAVPIPATFSLELGRVVRERQASIDYRFVSDYPFKNRKAHSLDAFERTSLAALRSDPTQRLTDVGWAGFNNTVRYIAPVIMGPTCVACHNSHPLSPKRDWKVGDVRGIQELIVTQPVAGNVFSFKYLVLYFLFSGAMGLGFIFFQRRQAHAIASINAELAGTNTFLAAISSKVSKYISPQIYKSIFSGASDATISTKRKKLTIFFSDIKDFTSTAERLQPEELTTLLNEYFTEMSAIALRHGGTVDKFVGDAILVFFGDPESLGIAEDARACLRMAVEMQRRLVELNGMWRRRGIERPFQVRMGINTGFCNVGNFGSVDRMDYTIIGAEANLAARLQSIAQPGSIVISYETHAFVREMTDAHVLEPITMKGISRPVIPYAVDGLRREGGANGVIVDEHTAGLDLYLDPAMLDRASAERARAVLQAAILALDKRSAAAGRGTEEAL